MGQPLIRLDSISKYFGKIAANTNVSLTINANEVLALLGENGAGKSTLMSILAGQLTPDSGTIYHLGKPLQLKNTEQALAAGIGMVYQHFKLVDAFSVAENVFLGTRSGFCLARKKMEETVRQLAAEYAMTVDPAARCADLSMGERQQVEILKLLHRRSEVLIFDEPTAVLTPKEAENLFTIIELMRQRGKGVVFISHKLEEVMRIADRIAILRRGEIIDSVAAEDVTSTAELAGRMVGRQVLLQVDRQPQETRQLVLQGEKLRTAGAKGLQDVALQLRQGEILALVGVAGNGQKELVEAVCGLRRLQSGELTILGRPANTFFAQKKDDPENTLAWIAEDRQGLATCPQLDLLDNFLLTTRRHFSGKAGLLDRRQAKERAKYLVDTFEIRPFALSAAAWQLSGGNLQKLVIAREFYRKPRLIVAEQPTQGLDIAAAEEVWKLLLKAREAAGILLVTGDLNEALALADRIGVMYGGRLVDCFSAADRGRVAVIPELMAGVAC